jgi:cytochrome c
MRARTSVASCKVTMRRMLLRVVMSMLLGTSAAHAAGDAPAGQKVFARCAACHSNAPGVNKVGPSLAGVVGRKSGTEPGFNYSPALKSADVTWDAASLDRFLQGPGSFIHGTRMFLNVPSAADRQNVIAYLQTLK